MKLYAVLGSKPTIKLIIENFLAVLLRKFSSISQKRSDDKLTYPRFYLKYAYFIK